MEYLNFDCRCRILRPTSGRDPEWGNRVMEEVWVGKCRCKEEGQTSQSPITNNVSVWLQGSPSVERNDMAEITDTKGHVTKGVVSSVRDINLSFCGENMVYLTLKQAK